MQKSSTRKLLAAVTVAGAANIAPAIAADGSQVNISIPGFCELEATTVVIVPGQATSMGFVEENCNSQEAYVIMANHRPLLTSESASISYDGQSTQLSSSGLTPVATRTGIQNGISPVIINQTSLDSDLVVSFTITSV